MKVKTMILHTDVMLGGGLGTHKTINDFKVNGIQLDHDPKLGGVLYKAKNRNGQMITGFLPLPGIAHIEYEVETAK